MATRGESAPNSGDKTVRPNQPGGAEIRWRIAADGPRRLGDVGGRVGRRSHLRALTVSMWSIGLASSGAGRLSFDYGTR